MRIGRQLVQLANQLKLPIGVLPFLELLKRAEPLLGRPMALQLLTEGLLVFTPLPFQGLSLRQGMNREPRKRIEVPPVELFQTSYPAIDLLLLPLQNVQASGNLGVLLHQFFHPALLVGKLQCAPAEYALEPETEGVHNRAATELRRARVST